MKTLTLRCPSCGNDAVSLSEQRDRAPNITQAAFVCNGCRCAFYGETILFRDPLPGMETFSGQPGKASEKGSLTDC